MGILVKNLRKRLNGVELYQNLSFEAKAGKITAIFGPNGSGKSTLFNILAGILPADGGEHAVTPFDKFRFSYLFQNYREVLLPWRTNARNITLPLESQKLPPAEIQERLIALSNTTALTVPLDRYPYELSGGQQQMVVFFRALVTNPTTLLFDEPFSALDYEHRLRFCNLLQAYHLKQKPTTLIITHDIEEAVYLADEIIVLSRKPTRVLGIIKNPLPYPRTVDMLHLPTFHKVKSEVLKLFQQEVAL